MTLLQEYHKNQFKPLLFHIFINHLFLLQIKSEICNFADDNTLYSCDKELGTVISNLKYDMTNILNWFRYNSMKANPDKFQFMILGPSDDKCFILKINAIEIRNTSEVIFNVESKQNPSEYFTRDL